jgi:hypothetical protein
VPGGARAAAATAAARAAADDVVHGRGALVTNSLDEISIACNAACFWAGWH